MLLMAGRKDLFDVDQLLQRRPSQHQVDINIFLAIPTYLTPSHRTSHLITPLPPTCWPRTKCSAL